MADALAGRFTVLFAEALDRVSRDQADVAAIYKRLSFADVRILGLGEGWIDELRVGLKGTMNQFFLKDVAAKTQRAFAGVWRRAFQRCTWTSIASPAREVVRGLIARVSVRWEDGQAVVALCGAPAALIGLATNAKGPAVAGPLAVR